MEANGSQRQGKIRLQGQHTRGMQRWSGDGRKDLFDVWLVSYNFSMDPPTGLVETAAGRTRRRRHGVGRQFPAETR
jgi:hypothetical protein